MTIEKGSEWGFVVDKISGGITPTGDLAREMAWLFTMRATSRTIPVRGVGYLSTPSSSRSPQVTVPSFGTKPRVG